MSSRVTEAEQNSWGSRNRHPEVRQQRGGGSQLWRRNRLPLYSRSSSMSSSLALSAGARSGSSVFCAVDACSSVGRGGSGVGCGAAAEWRAEAACCRPPCARAGSAQGHRRGGAGGCPDRPRAQVDWARWAAAGAQLTIISRDIHAIQPADAPFWRAPGNLTRQARSPLAGSPIADRQAILQPLPSTLIAIALAPLPCRLPCSRPRFAGRSGQIVSSLDRSRLGPKALQVLLPP